MDLKKILPTDGPPVNEVLKYVEKYKNEIIVIKYGGNVFIDRKIFDNFIKDLSVLNKLGLQVVVVHGGGPRIKKELSKQKIESKFIRGLRVTDEKIINVVETVLIDFNDDIVNFNTNKKFDLILIRDLFIHIQNSDIKKIIQNIEKINFRYVALNSYNNKMNHDVIVGKHRKINLLIEPFNLNQPLEYFKDYEDDKFIFLYDKKNFIQNLVAGSGIEPLTSGL